MPLWHGRANGHSMTEQPRSAACVQRPKPLTDFNRRDRHEFVQNSLTSTGKEEAVHWVHQKLIGLRVRTCGFRN
jgi:hypothetical protein